MTIIIPPKARIHTGVGVLEPRGCEVDQTWLKGKKSKSGTLIAPNRKQKDPLDGSVGTDGVGNIVGSVGEGSGAGSEDLKEREGVLGLGRVLNGSLVHGLESSGLLVGRRLLLLGVDVDRGSVRDDGVDLLDEVERVPPRSVVGLVLDLGERNVGSGGRDGSLDVVGVVVLLGVVERVGPSGSLVSGSVVLLLLVDSVVGNVAGSTDGSSVGGSLSPPEQGSEEEVVESEG